MNSILAKEQANALKKLGAFNQNVSVNFENAEKKSEINCKDKVRITAKYKQNAMQSKERIENEYSSTIDSKANKQAKKLAFLKKIGRR